ncbi:hypothetical protein R3W88_023221 [Solanum pinnatisectum]|uniref:Uncharacterized protein n=1 Tax=Solanum pinnatisectum TaxID=50273 RepID=A0AAV9LXM6_9SOLN|nr:hypothetical protein R3W88_023221 [Solanum pinnatisectum]
MTSPKFHSGMTDLFNYICVMVVSLPAFTSTNPSGLQLPFDPGVYVTHEVIFLCDMCNDIRSLMHIEYPCITANHVVGVVSSVLLFLQLQLLWQPYTIVASSHGDNNCIVLGLLEQLNNIGDKWYISVFGPAPPTSLNHLQLSNGHSIVEWVDDCSVVILWITFASCIRLFYGLMSLGYSVEIAKDFLGEQNKRQVDQLENFHLPLRDQMLLLEGANTTSNTIIDALGTTTAAREFISENLLISCSTMLDLFLVGEAPNRLKMWSCSQYKIKCLLDVFEIGKRYIVLVTSLEKLPLNECKLPEVGFMDAGRIRFKLVEKVVVPWSAFRTTEILLILVELDPTILNALRSKLHKVFNVDPLVLPSSSLKQLLDVNLVRHGCILWFKKQNDGSLLKVALDNEVFKEFLWVVNTYKEEHDNTVLEDLCEKMPNYIWDPRKIPIYRRGKYSISVLL